MNGPSLEHGVEIGGRVASVGGGIGAFTLWGLQAGELAAVGGLIVALCGLIVQVVIAFRRDRRAQDEHALRMEVLLANPNTVTRGSVEDSESYSES